MSQITEKSPKHCGQKQGLHHMDKMKKRMNKKMLFSLSTFFLSILLLIFVIYLLLHPSKPRFSLQQADIYQFNITSPNTLNSSIQITMLSNNPNQKVGIYYDVMEVYGTYKGQQITLYTSLPPFYQGHDDSNLLSAFLVGNGLPVAPGFGYEVERDRTAAGRMVLDLKVNGRLRWKVGTWVSGRYRFNVDCVAVVPFGPLSTSPSSPPRPLSSRLGAQCSTSI